MKMRIVYVVITGFIVLAFTPGKPFTFQQPGALSPGSGKGRIDKKNYAPGIRFPLERAPAFANSQVFNPGGQNGRGGSQCAASNYDYPWRDTYCETRSWPIALCPAGEGHQGQDIRPSSCEKDVHWAVAVIDGTITNVGTFTVYLLSPDGRTRFDYLHMSNVVVHVGDKVKRGARLGKVSNIFNGAPTTIHLHFNIRQNLPNLGWTFVPPYAALIDAYQRLAAGKP
jgi:murein DD-endopeptidase MepM/ murein hydrolase activator NlpD